MSGSSWWGEEIHLASGPEFWHGCVMATDYEQFYRDNKQGLGAPAKPFVDFFQTYGKSAARVLDVGCGQGRDALFIARLDHQVTAVDLSPTGIADLRADAAREGLRIDAHVGDIRTFDRPGPFDVIVIDRTLHMLAEEPERMAVLERLISQTLEGSFVLIADERANLPAFERAFAESAATWRPLYRRGGYMFMGRA